MSERPRSRSNQFFRELTPAVLKGTAAGIGLGAIGLVGTTILSHRERTHESVKLHPILTAFFELEQQTYGIIPSGLQFTEFITIFPMRLFTHTSVFIEPCRK